MKRVILGIILVGALALAALYLSGNVVTGFRINAAQGDYFIVPDMEGAVFRKAEVQSLWPGATSKGISLDFDPVTQSKSPSGTLSLMKNVRINGEKAKVPKGMAELAVYTPDQAWGVEIGGVQYSECVLTGVKDDYYLQIFLVPKTAINQMNSSGITILFWPDPVIPKGNHETLTI